MRTKKFLFLCSLLSLSACCGNEETSEGVVQNSCAPEESLPSPPKFSANLGESLQESWMVGAYTADAPAGKVEFSINEFGLGTHIVHSQPVADLMDFQINVIHLESKTEATPTSPREVMGSAEITYLPQAHQLMGHDVNQTIHFHLLGDALVLTVEKGKSSERSFTYYAVPSPPATIH